MSIGAFVAGRYTSTYGGSTNGITRDGYALMISPKAESVNQTDAWAQTLIDLIFQGIDVDIALDGVEYANMLGILAGWASLGSIGVIARLGSAVAAALVLTSTAGTPAATTPASLTASRSIFAPGSQSSIPFSSRLRNVPMRVNCLPSDAGAHFTTS